MMDEGALLLWPLVAFALLGWLGPTRGTIIAFLGGMLLLPANTGFDPPLVPELTRNEITGLAVLLGTLALRRGRVTATFSPLGQDLVLLVILAGAAGTALTNGDRPHANSTPLASYDIISMFAADALALWLPFFLGRIAVRGPADLRTLFRLMALAALLYSLLIMIELRFSPQIHRWVYGVHPHSFFQHVRYGGYRPMVFMGTGLAVALFIFTAAMGSMALARAREPISRFASQWVAGWLAVILVLCKSLASLLYGLAVGPVILLFSARRIALFAALLAGFVAIYPVLQVSGAFPTRFLVDTAQLIDADRAHSLDFRFTNEEVLLDHTSGRKAFGWGGHNRNRVYNETTRRRVITDSFWVIVYSTRGFVGLAVVAWLLLRPVIRARRLAARYPTSDRRMVGALALVVAVQAVDLLINGLFNGLSLFTAGALVGACSGGRAEAPDLAAAEDAPASRAEPASERDATMASLTRRGRVPPRREPPGRGAGEDR